jgi:two-component system, probable response regulator PhcQ
MLLDDETNVLHALQRNMRSLFPEKELRVEAFSDPEQALLRLGEVSFDAIVSDYLMPGINGVEFLKAAKRIQADAVRLILSASMEFTTAMDALNKAEAFRFIVKPWSNEQLKEILLLAFERKDQMLEERRLADEVRVKRGDMAPQDFEARRLEEHEPGIMKVNWGPDGSVRLHEDDE